MPRRGCRWIRERWVLRGRAGLAPTLDPQVRGEGRAGVAVDKVKKYLAKMDSAMDYDFYNDDDLRYIRFKSPFNCRPLIGRRPPLGYAVLLHAPACWFVRTLAEINFGELFGNFDGFAPWCLGVCVQEERGESQE